MLTPVEMVLFLLAVVASLYLAQRTFRPAAAINHRGEGHLYKDNLPRRIWRAVEVAVTQRTVLRARVGTSIIHTFIVWGFLFYALVNVGDVLEGYFDIQFLGDGPLPERRTHGGPPANVPNGQSFRAKWTGHADALGPVREEGGRLVVDVAIRHRTPAQWLRARLAGQALGKHAEAAARDAVILDDPAQVPAWWQPHVADVVLGRRPWER